MAQRTVGDLIQDEATKAQAKYEAEKVLADATAADSTSYTVLVSALSAVGPVGLVKDDGSIQVYRVDGKGGFDASEILAPVTVSVPSPPAA